MKGQDRKFVSVCGRTRLRRFLKKLRLELVSREEFSGQKNASNYDSIT